MLMTRRFVASVTGGACEFGDPVGNSDCGWACNVLPLLVGPGSRCRLAAWRRLGLVGSPVHRGIHRWDLLGGPEERHGRFRATGRGQATGIGHERHSTD